MSKIVALGGEVEDDDDGDDEEMKELVNVSHHAQKKKEVVQVDEDEVRPQCHCFLFPACSTTFHFHFFLKKLNYL